MKKVMSIILATGITAVCILPIGASAVRKPELTVKNAENGVKLIWNNTRASKYSLQRRTAKRKFKTIKTVSGKFSFTDKSAKSGKKYAYRLISNGLYSKEKKILYLSSPKIKSIGNGDLEGMTIKWNKVKGAQKYEVYRAEVTDGKTGQYKKIDTVKTNRFDYMETSGQAHKYKIRAVNKTYKSAFGNEKKYTHMERVIAFAAVNSAYDGINISWEHIKGADEYYIYKAVKNEDKFTKIAEVSKVDTVYTESGLKLYQCEYTDNEVKDGESYRYYVVAKAGGKLTEKNYVDEITFKQFDYEVSLKAGDVDTTTLDYSVDGDIFRIESVKSTDEAIVTVEKTAEKKAVLKALNKGTAYVEIKYKTDGSDGITVRYKITVE